MYLLMLHLFILSWITVVSTASLWCLRCFGECVEPIPKHGC